MENFDTPMKNVDILTRATAKVHTAKPVLATLADLMIYEGIVCEIWEEQGHVGFHYT